MANFDAIIDHYSKRFISVLKNNRITHEEYLRILGTNFSSRVFFFENVASVRQIRAQVGKSIMKETFANALTPVEKKFIEKYNNIASFLEYPLFQSEDFIQKIKSQKDFPYYTDQIFLVGNRTDYSLKNPNITALVKESKEFRDIEEDYERDIKAYTCDVISGILHKVSFDEKLWN